MVVCSECKKEKSRSSFTKTQLGRGPIKRCKACVSGIGDPPDPVKGATASSSVSSSSVEAETKPVSRSQSQQQQHDLCSVCAVVLSGANAASHMEGKRHKTNVALSLLPGYVSRDAAGLSDAVCEAIRVPKMVNWISPEQIAIAAGVQSIRESNIAASRFQYAFPDKFGFLRSRSSTEAKQKQEQLCTEAQRTAARALVDMRTCGIPYEFFDVERQSYREELLCLLCTPKELETARECQRTATISIVESGLEQSRFDHIGVPVGRKFCTPAELEEAKALRDARKEGIPLGFYRDIDDVVLPDEEEDYDYGRNRKQKKKQPIWATADAVERASNQWDGYSVWEEVCRENGMAYLLD